MKSINYIAILIITALIGSCSGDNGGDLEKKKAKLDALRTESNNLKAEIRALEAEIVAIDPSFGKNENNIILVSASPIQQGSFEHKVEIRGAVQSRKNVMMSAEATGKIERILVKEGQNVKRGQVLVVLNADVIKNNIQEVETQLELAEIVYNRQSNLWEQNIGTEIQYLEARNTVESLKRRLRTLASQREQATLRAPFDGTIDEIPVNEGEMATTGMPLIRIMQPDDMYIQADVSEAFIGKFEANDEVGVYFPSLDKELTSRVLSVSQVINSQNRTFSIEVELPKLDFMVKPNQVVVMTLQDYFTEQAYVVPTNIIQSDDKGTFIYKLNESGDSFTANKLHVRTGLSYNSKTELVSGIEGTERVIDQGFRELTDGVEVKLSSTQLGLN
jgi:RND family efflux transporter MFP subunit